MPSDDELSEEFDMQIGANEVDKKEIDFGEEFEFIEFEVEYEPIFRQLAMSIYESESAGIREPLLNAITAVIEAQQDYDLDKVNGIVEVTVEQQSEGRTLIIQDNGVGVTEARLKEVMSVIGRSLNRDSPELAGKFGVGFLALWMLAGLDGGFEMHTQSRVSGSEPISGIWKSGGFAWNKAEKSKFESDQYGTRFEIPLIDDISIEDIREWVSETVEYSRIPVRYTELTPDGSIEFEEEYGISSLEDELSESSPRIIIENEYYKIIAGKECSGETILLDVPIERNADYLSGLPFYNFDIRLKKENSVVVSGKHEGKMVISRNEYEQIDSERKESYVPRSNLTDSDVAMPSPIGTRDMLNANPQFWEYITNEIKRYYDSKLSNIYQDIDKIDNVFTLPKQDQNLLLHSITEYKDFKKTLATSISEKLEVDIPEDLGKKIELLKYDFELAPRNEEGVSKKAYRKEMKVLQIERKRRNKTGVPTGKIYMGVSINEDKARIVWEDAEKNQVVKIDSTDQYQKFEQSFGWEKLKDISKETLSAFDVSEETKQEFTKPNQTSPTEKQLSEHRLTFHSRENSKRTVDIKLEDIVEEHKKLKATESPSFDTVNPYYLVVFPSTVDAKISNNYHLADDLVILANCSKTEYEYIEDCERVYTIEEFVTQAAQVELMTSEGYLKPPEFTENSVFHIVSGYSSRFKKEKYLERFAEYLENFVLTGDDFFTPDIDSATYIPVTLQELARIRPYLTEDSCIVNGEHKYTGLGNVVSMPNNTRIYGYARLYDWDETPEMTIIKQLDSNFEQTGFDFIETLGKLYDKNEEPHSEIR